jgi:hypothetical protein
VVNALIAFAVAGDVMALPETGELDALLAELRDPSAKFTVCFRRQDPRRGRAEG